MITVDKMRSFQMPYVHHEDYSAPMLSTMKSRGTCLIAIEFLTRYPAAECVVTQGCNPFWDCVFDIFPKTLFHAFSSEVEDPPRPNVIRHRGVFDERMAERFGSRGTPYNIIFFVENMQLQEEGYRKGKPTAALLWVTESVSEYLDGELYYPLYCSQDSGMCALVPSPGLPQYRDYSPYKAGIRWFQDQIRFPGSAYDLDMENSILLSCTRRICGICNEQNTLLQVEVARSSLPSKSDPDVIFHWPVNLYSSLTDENCFVNTPNNCTQETHYPERSNQQREDQVVHGYTDATQDEPAPQMTSKDLEALLMIAASVTVE
jgi:hypothetical protein